MAHLRYVVERNQEASEHDWSVTFGGEHFGHFHTQQEALDAALGDAERVARLGHDIEVRVHRRDGEEVAVWTYDPGRQCMVQADSGGHRPGPEPDLGGGHAVR